VADSTESVFVENQENQFSFDDPPDPAERQTHIFIYEVEKLECNEKIKSILFPKDFIKRLLLDFIFHTHLFVKKAII